LFISGYLNRNRSNYYKVLRNVTRRGDWIPYVDFMLDAFVEQSLKTKETLFSIMGLHEELKSTIREKFKVIYSADLVDHLFTQPITTPVRMSEALGIHYTTASKYLHELAGGEILKDKKVGKYHFFANSRLISLL